jgi:hypothetical protein
MAPSGGPRKINGAEKVARSYKTAKAGLSGLLLGWLGYEHRTSSRMINALRHFQIPCYLSTRLLFEPTWFTKTSYASE